VRSSEIADDWSERWREFHRPLVLDGRLTVRPPWEPPAGTPVEIVIDPGQAFGTGAHATTRLCLELLLELDPVGGFADVGCGSGVLAIAAARLGFRPVWALDNDPAAIEAATANAAANGVELEVRRDDLRVAPLPPADTVAANLLGPLLLAWARQLAGHDRLPKRVIASGLLAAEAQGVVQAFGALGLGATRLLECGEWAALLLER
jgi:ribosomal protein L11 methyltransferase